MLYFRCENLGIKKNTHKDQLNNDAMASEIPEILSTEYLLSHKVLPLGVHPAGLGKNMLCGEGRGGGTEEEECMTVVGVVCKGEIYRANIGHTNSTF